MDIQSYDHHTGPGRRLAKGCTRGDTLMALFGFAAHAFLFLSIGAGIALASTHAGTIVLWVSGTVALFLLVLRASQVGVSTTNESVQAIREAWTNKNEKLEKIADEISERLSSEAEKLTYIHSELSEASPGPNGELVFADATAHPRNVSLFYAWFDVNSPNAIVVKAECPMLTPQEEAEVCRLVTKMHTPA